MLKITESHRTERVFIISIRKDIDKCYEFPEPFPLQLRLKDMLDAEVDEKYYLKKTLNITTKENYIQWDNSGKGYNSQQDRAYYQDGLSPTLSHCNNNGNKSQVVLCDKPISVGGNRMPKTYGDSTDFRIRKLTPKECWRLQGFDDEDFYKAEAVNSNTQLYKQAGNSIVVDVLEAIFTNLKPYLSERE